MVVGASVGTRPGSRDRSQKEKSDSVETNDKKFKIEGGCVVQQNKAGEFLFCEAVKVDASLSDADLRKKA